MIKYDTVHREFLLSVNLTDHKCQGAGLSELVCVCIKQAAVSRSPTELSKPNLSHKGIYDSFDHSVLLGFLHGALFRTCDTSIRTGATIIIFIS